VPARDDLGALTDRLGFHGVETRDDGRTVEFEDPWANRIQVRSVA
jgi:catechol 2,3-dioxygenase